MVSTHRTAGQSNVTGAEGRSAKVIRVSTVRATRSRRCAALVATLGAAALVAAGCGQPSTVKSSNQNDSIVTKFDAMMGSNRESELLKEAKKEGQVTVYGSTSTTPVIAKAFTKKYGIKVNVYNGGTEADVQKVLVEAQAGHGTADVIEDPASDLETLNRQYKILDDYESPYRKEVPASGQGKGWTATREHAFVVGYNTKLLPTSQLPTSYQAFADPQWKGKIVVEPGDYDWFYGLYSYFQHQGMSDADIDDLFKKIAANAKVVKGHTSQSQGLASGQYDAAMSVYTDTMSRVIADGAPVTWGGAGKPTVQPVVTRYEADALLKDAPHPAAGILWMDFNLSPDGVQASLAIGDLPTVPFPNNPLQGVQTWPVDTVGLSNADSTWSTKYDQVLRGATS
jgi:iron(III) transport system substrate-binding protein